jgi:hypothetical protein
VLALPTALLAAQHAGGSPATGLSVAAFLLTGCVIPTTLTLALVRVGRATAFDLRERSERLLPAAVTAGCCASMAWLLARMGAPQSICNLAVAVAIQMALLACLTLRWKVSYHAASASTLVLVSYSASGTGLLTLGFVALAMSIAWARVYQRRHTLAQVAVGALTAIPIAMLA